MLRSIDQEDVPDVDDLLRCCFCEHSMREPILLPCLHNACASCVNEARSREPFGNVTCASCGPTDSAASLTRNSLLSGQATLAALLRGELSCDIPQCQNRGGSLESWCTNCSQFVCDECAPEHRHARGARGVEERCASFISLEDQQALHRLAAQLKQQCSEHRRMFEHFCLECEKPKCGQCFDACFSLRHELEDFECSESSRYAAHMWQEVDKFRTVAGIKEKLLQQHVDLQSTLMASRKNHVYTLKVAKRKMMDAVQRAYTSCKAAVNEIYDQLEAKAVHVHDTASRLQCAVRQARRYSRLLLETDGIASLLEQRCVVLSRLKELTKELQFVREPRATNLLISHNVALPEKLTDVPSGWFGTPKLLTDNFFCSEDELLQYYHCLVPDPASARNIALPAECLDLAATASGSVIVAAGSQGILEYDRSGDELSRWSPPPVDPAPGKDDVDLIVVVPQVTSVDVLPDQRLAVGLSCAPFISLLQRDAFEHRIPGVPGSWTEVCRIVALQAPCWQLAACGPLIAATEARWNDGLHRLLPTHRVGLFWEGRDMHFRRLELSYAVFTVAVSSRAVVTASDSRVKLSQSDSFYVLDGYSHCGRRLWRCAVKEPVWDLRFERNSESIMLYGALPLSGRVIAFSDLSGRKLRSIAIPITGHKSARDPRGRRPLRITRIFLDSSCSGSELVVLCSDSTTVRLYRCETSAALDTSSSMNSSASAMDLLARASANRLAALRLDGQPLSQGGP